MHTLSPETKERLYLHIYAREHTKTCMCVQMYVYIWWCAFELPFKSALLPVCTLQPSIVCAHVCLMEVDFVVSLGDSEDCHQYCTFFSSELSNVSTCVYVCVCLCMCVCVRVCAGVRPWVCEAFIDSPNLTKAAWDLPACCQRVLTKAKL